MKSMAAPQRVLVLVGDMNVRGDEVGALRESFSVEEALYHGCSWDPRKNRYLAEDQDLPRSGQRFDRVFFRGAVFGVSYLVGQCRQFKDGVDFCLSDHFGVLALLDVSAAHLGRTGQGVVRDRRQALTRLRDQESLAELQVAREMLRIGREEAALMRARAADRDRGDFLEAARREAKAAEAQHEARRSAAFGRHSLFCNKDVMECEAPVPPADLAIDSLAGLPSGDGVSMWRRLGQLPVIALANTGSMCYASCVAQVLLRVPCVSLWLQAHVTQCEGFASTDGDAGERCAACSLWATRLQLGSAAVPELVRQRAAIDSRFAGQEQHDAAEFMQLLLMRLRGGEVRAGRATEWRVGQTAETQATHVDRLFGFVQETRRQCKQCASCSACYAPSNVLVLPVPPADERERPWTVTDLYFLWARPQELVGEDAVECSACGGQRTSHVQQCRVRSRPNVLIVQVRRTVAGSSDALRHLVFAEEEVSLPDVGSFELTGVVYHSGRGVTSGQYTCACRGPDRQFWRYDKNKAWRSPSEIGRLLPRSVYVLVYTRPRGVAVFSGMCEIAGSDNGPAPARQGPGSAGAGRAAGSSSEAKVEGTDGYALKSSGELGPVAGVSHGRESEAVSRPSASSPVGRVLVRKTSLAERENPISRSPLREATSLERVAKARRLDKAGIAEDVDMDLIGNSGSASGKGCAIGSGKGSAFTAPSAKRLVLSEACEETELESSAEPAAKLQRVGSAPDAPFEDASEGHRAGSGQVAREHQAAAAEARARANQARGVGDLKKTSAMQAAAGAEECFGAARADALREQIRRSKSGQRLLVSGHGVGKGGRRVRRGCSR